MPAESSTIRAMFALDGSGNSATVTKPSGGYAFDSSVSRSNSSFCSLMLVSSLRQNSLALLRFGNLSYFGSIDCRWNVIVPQNSRACICTGR